MGIAKVRATQKVARWRTAPPRAHASPPFAGRARVGLLILFAFVVLARIPDIVLRGRFFGEEGTYFFAYAWHRPAWEALWHALGGYLNIAATGTTLLAARLVKGGWLALDQAPYVTILVSFLFQLCPAMLVLTGRAAWLSRRWAVLGALAVLAMSPKTEEVWLNVLHIQFQLAACILIMTVTGRPASQAGATARLCLAFLAPLCGPVAIILLPFMAVRAALDGERWRWAEVSALGLGSAIQLLGFYAPLGVRAQSPDAGAVAAVLFLRHVVMPLASPRLGYLLGPIAYRSVAAGAVAWWAVGGAILYMGALAVMAWRRRSLDALLLLGAGLTLAGASYHGGLLTDRGLFDVAAGQRYNFVPQIAFSLSLIALTMASTGQARRAFFAMLAVMAVVAVYYYPSPSGPVAHGPDWREEVARWRRDRSYPLAVWPLGWTMDLSDRDLPCPTRITAPNPPSYCDGPWEIRERKSLLDMRRPNIWFDGDKAH